MQYLLHGAVPLRPDVSVQPERLRTDVLCPRWDAARRELSVDGQIIKRFRLPAANQQAILTAFEEEGWPVAIVDPLPPRGKVSCKQRLHETIKALNRTRLARLIRFAGDGTGEGVLWQWCHDWR